MRRAVLITSLALTVSAPAFAEWIEYKNPVEAFMVNFPAEPKVENITYTTESGAKAPAKLFGAVEGPGRYTITVVDFSGSPRDEANAMAHAAAQMRPKGEVKFDYDSELDGIHGHQLSMILAGGAQYQESRFRLSEDDGPARDGVGEDTFVPVYVKVTWQACKNAAFELLGGVSAGGELRLEDRKGHKISDEDYDPAALFGVRAVLTF